LLIGVVLMATAMQVKVPPRTSSPFGLGIAIAAATPIYFAAGQSVDLRSTLLVLGFGCGLGLLVHSVRARIQQPLLVVAQLAGIAVYALIFGLVLPLAPSSTSWNEWRVMIPLVLGSAAWLSIIHFASRFERRHSLWAEPMREFIDDANVFISLVGTGALLALAYRRLGWWAIGVAGLPFLFAQSAFGRFLTIKRTYRQTIRALARIPEVAGLGVDGHADRTARLASEIGFDLGLSRKELEDLEYAALMHDIGRITLTEPAILRVGYTDDDIARWGAEIISEAPSLTGVAELVRKLHEPYRKPGEQSDPGISILSKVVRAASSYDHLIVERNLSPLQAVEVLHQGAAYDFDPAVIAALRRVLERRLAFHPVQA
jgi:hypothetical protein